MLTYLDESYASKTHKPKKEFLLIGALFLPNKSSQLHLQKGLIKIKSDANFFTPNSKFKEIKYNKLLSDQTLELAKKAVDLFIDNYRAFFRVGIIEYDKSDLRNMNRNCKSQINKNIKKAMLYTKIVEHLIKNNYRYQKIYTGTLLMDYLTRCKGDQFNEIIKRKLIDSKNKVLSHFSYVDSKSETHQPIQICDLLLGAVRNNFFPTRNKYKTKFRNYVNKRLVLPKKEYWKKDHQQGLLEAKYHKFFVKFYKIPYQF